MITLTAEQAQQIEEALSELMDLMDGVREGDYKPDSFTNQPAEEALATIRAARAQEQAEQEPVLHVGDSSFEDWYQAHPKASGGDKQLARDAYVAGMGDPLVAPVKQEPVAWMHKQRNAVVYSALEMQCFPYKERQFFTPLYAAPVRTKGLTDDEIRKLWDDAELDITWFARAVIAADREKNK